MALIFYIFMLFAFEMHPMNYSLSINSKKLNIFDASHYFDVLRKIAVSNLLTTSGIEKIQPISFGNN